MTETTLPMDNHWLPFTPNRQFRHDPRIFVGADGMHFITHDGRQVIDGISSLWCVGAGHNRKPINEAIKRQLDTLDYATAFQAGNDKAFLAAQKIAQLAPGDLNKVLFCNSGSEAADTSLKVALAYHRALGEGHRTVFIGREKGYHGVNFGGISVGGMVGNRKMFGQAIEADHLPHTQPPAGSFHRGLPKLGPELADELLNIIALHDASTIAAVIVEPFAGSGGVVVPPQGYLQRLREICTANNILLIFDEVISGFGRSGAWTGAEAFGVTPDMLNFAKQVTNGAQPLGGVVAKKEIYDTFMAAGGPEYMLELAHGYTYSAHPVACAAGLASIDLLEKENAIARVQELAPLFENAVHGLKGSPHVTDIRNFGLAAGLTIANDPSAPGKRPYDISMAMFKKGFYVRYGADVIALAPPFISTPAEIDRLVSALGDTLHEVG